MHEGHRERLRERYKQNGLEGFSDHEILELLLSFVIPRRNTNDIGHTLVRRFGSIDAALQQDIETLTQVPGIGAHTAVFLRLHGQIIRRCIQENSLPQSGKRLRLNTPSAAAAYAQSLMMEERYECVYVISLDKNFNLLHAERLFSGTLTEAPLYPRRVVESALQNRAHAVLLLHNHPSGDPAPSENDLSATEAVKTALNSIDIQLYDHIIAGNGVVYSCLRGILIEPAQQAGDPPRHIRFPQRPRSHASGSEYENIAAEPDIP